MLSILVFLLTISILVVVHEYGHYLFARIFKVKVITFCVGFGPKIFSIHTKSNEWRISLIPFGGYVRMLDEREGIVTADEKHLAFNNKMAYQKILIAFAGPLFNLLFAVLVYYFIALLGITQIKPIISSINPTIIQNTLKANINTPSEIIDINGYLPTSWTNANEQFNAAIINQTNFSIKLKSLVNQNIQIVDVNSGILRSHFKTDIYLENMGLYPIKYLAEIAYIEPNSVAAKSGLKIADKIIAINSQPITNWFQVAEIIQKSANISLQITINRLGDNINYTITPTSKRNPTGQIIGILGIMPKLDENLLHKNSFTQKYDMLYSFNYALLECYRVISFNLQSIYQIITGEISLYNLGGPITIAKVGTTAIHDGIIGFAQFLALISIGLAIMNLLPIPVLDGGHILLYTIELITKKQLAPSIQVFIFKLGFVFVIGLSLFAIYNDMMRL